MTLAYVDVPAEFLLLRPRCVVGECCAQLNGLGTSAVTRYMLVQYMLIQRIIVQYIVVQYILLQFLIQSNAPTPLALTFDGDLHAVRIRALITLGHSTVPALAFS